MNGFDTNFDMGNEFYTVNGVANYYRDHPIKVKVGEPLRIYLSNMTEFDMPGTERDNGVYFHFSRTFYVFHAHQSEFAELGWMGMFEVVE